LIVKLVSNLRETMLLYFEKKNETKLNQKQICGD